MTELGLVVLVIMCCALMVPFLVYVSVKVGTYAFYRGRDLYLKDKEHEIDHKR